MPDKKPDEPEEQDTSEMLAQLFGSTRQAPGSDEQDKELRATARRLFGRKEDEDK